MKSLIPSPSQPAKTSIADSLWFQLQFTPAEGLTRYGIPIPNLPPDDVQMRFTGRTGHANLQQAFSFYLYLSSVCDLHEMESPKILDFGGGWGRIARFFLRDTKTDRITVTDCMSDSVHWLRQTKNPCHIIQNDPFPPIPGLDADFDVIYAFSVFSHLSEKYQNAWFDCFLSHLRPGGHLVVTTRGRQFIEILKTYHTQHLVNNLTTKLPMPDELLARYAAGEFQFYSTGVTGCELQSAFYGEALIPRAYFQKKYGSLMIDFSENVPYVDQAVLVLRKPLAADQQIPLAA
jgi:phospholipid N-methyltransferase